MASEGSDLQESIRERLQQRLGKSSREHPGAKRDDTSMSGLIYILYTIYIYILYTLYKLYIYIYVYLYLYTRHSICRDDTSISGLNITIVAMVRLLRPRSGGSLSPEAVSRPGGPLC